MTNTSIHKNNWKGCGGGEGREEDFKRTSNSMLFNSLPSLLGEFNFYSYHLHPAQHIIQALRLTLKGYFKPVLQLSIAIYFVQAEWNMHGGSQEQPVYASSTMHKIV